MFLLNAVENKKVNPRKEWQLRLWHNVTKAVKFSVKGKLQKLNNSYG